MSNIVLVCDGSSRASDGGGYGSFAILKNNQRTLTHLEFGSRMTNHEAAYDTLITALKTLVRQESAADTALEVQTPSGLVVNQVKGTWATREQHLIARRDQVHGLAASFASMTITRISREQANRLLAR
jgi:ribonuclease HI